MKKCVVICNPNSGKGDLKTVIKSDRCLSIFKKYGYFISGFTWFIWRRWNITRNV